MQAALLSLGFQPFHDAAAAVFVADRVGAAARKAQPGQGIGVHVGADGLAQLLDVLPESIGTAIDFAVLMAGAVQGDLVACGGDVGNFIQVRFVGILSTDKKGCWYVLFFQYIQNFRRVGAGAVVKGKADDFGHGSLPRCGGRDGGKAIVGGGGLGVLGVIQKMHHRCQHRRQQPQHQKNEQILRYSFPFFVAAHSIPSLGLVMYMQVGTRLCFACGGHLDRKKDLPQGGRS